MESFIEKTPSFLEELHWIFPLVILFLIVGGAFYFNRYLTNKFEGYNFKSKRLWFLVVAILLSYYSLNSISSLRYFSNNIHRILTILSVAITFTCFLFTMYYNCLVTNVFYGIVITIIQINVIYFSVFLALTAIMLFLGFIVIITITSSISFIDKHRIKTYYKDEYGNLVDENGNRIDRFGNRI